MATQTSQRIFIWVITVVMIVGTVFSFFVMIISSKNDQTDQKRYTKLTEQYQKKVEQYQKEVQAQGDELSKKYYSKFKQYKDAPKAFASGDVKKLTTKDLKVGSGKKVTDGDSYSAYYIGWNPKGKSFDSSFEGNKLKVPLDPSMGLIKGWEEGVKGMKVGGIRELTIPSDKAYGEAGQGEDIPANTPLKFIVMAIAKPKEIQQPAIPAELMQMNGQ